MAGGCGAGAGGWRRAASRARALRGAVRDTQNALRDVGDILQFEPSISAVVQEVGELSSRPTALVVLGASPDCRARLVRALLGRPLLPTPAPRGWRWLRIQYGSSTQVQLTLGNSEFELVEDLECNARPWDTLPLQDLLRQDATDLTTILELELNNAFLKDGIKIIVPPDLDNPGTVGYRNLKKTHSEFYAKRNDILKNFTPVYLYALDRIGKNIFSENVECGSRMVESQSEEDFWANFDLYSIGSGNVTSEREKCSEQSEKEMWTVNCDRSVFNSENCLDLHQLKDLNPKSQVLFLLFSDSKDVEEENARERVRDLRLSAEATESTESNDQYRTEELPESDQGFIQDGLRETLESPRDARRVYETQMAFMNELLEQWELMTGPPQKHYVKSQWAIIEEAEILRAMDHKSSATLPSSTCREASESCARGCKRDERRLKDRTGLLNTVVKFATNCCHSYLLEYWTRLSEVHVKLVQQFILASFDMARELQALPAKIQYVASSEQHLYETIIAKFSDGDKKQELVQMMQEVLEETKAEINSMDWSVDDVPCHQDNSCLISNSMFYSASRTSPELTISRPNESFPHDLSVQQDYLTSQSGQQSGRICREAPSDGEEAVSCDSYNFDDYDIIHENDESLCVSDSFRVNPTYQPSVSTIPVENEKLWSMTRSTWSKACAACSGVGRLSVRQASLDVQQTVLSNLSRKISLKLVKFVDCLKDSYFGTLQRCLESLELVCLSELGGRPASSAMTQLLSVSRQVDLQPCASFSLLSELLVRLRRLLYSLRVSVSPRESACALSGSWRRACASRTAAALQGTRLARLVSAQILSRVSVAHERYQSALTALDAALASRLHHTEDVKLAIRKKYAPLFAQLCLESTSMCDQLMFGIPELGREIGRGQYGVVYSVRGGWGGRGGRGPVAVKSVLPHDDRHYRDLAMEFFYTRSIPSHPRIVRLFGSIVQRHSGAGPNVLLVSERKVRDLHAAVRAGLSFRSRMQISCDIVEGIRYLHSLGLVHRDIKMKNVLLDNQDRAALSDLGFCAAEALMSGSVVGTPVHMAPELLAGQYDAHVDVYAFGVLFWYVCAGNIRLPSAFEAIQNKEQLWSKVKRGLRPERLPQFTSSCWDIMTSCWDADPGRRALLGDVQRALERVRDSAPAPEDGQLHTADENLEDNAMD